MPLCGYLIYGHLIVRHRPFLSYFRRRVQRIYATFLVVFFVYIVLSLLLPARSKISSADSEAFYYVAENLLLLPGVLPIEPLITVAWSLSYEFAYYLATPLIILILN